MRPQSEAQSPEAILLWGSLIGIAAGLISALAFVAFYFMLPLKPAILLTLLISLSFTQIRSASPLGAANLKASYALTIALLVVLKMEILAEIDSQWIAATLICGSAWSRACVLALHPHPMTGARPPATASRFSSLILGIVPLLALAIWPEPIWGFWVAAVATAAFARFASLRGWAASLSARWIAAEALFMLCVLLLLSVAALLEVVPQEETGS